VSGPGAAKTPCMGGEAREKDPFAGLRIQVVDDDPSIVNCLSRMLRDNSFLVSSACDGEKAYEMILKDRPDLVITDLCMPKMDGLELIRRLRADAATEFLPVIILSSQCLIEDHLKGYEMGVDDYLDKPFSLEEMLLRIKNLLLKAGSGRGNACTDTGVTGAGR